jgi:DNA-directed RNA polymerase subunit RPC12/RpoP
MYYLDIDPEDPNKLRYICHNCGHINTNTIQNGLCIVNEQYKGSNLEISHLINPYTKLDPTLPRIWNLRCPNTECTTNHGEKLNEPTEIIYIKYNVEDLKFLYMCVTCDTIWKTNE